MCYNNFMKETKYSREQFQYAVDKSKSQKDVIIALNLPLNNGNYETVRYLSNLYSIPLPEYNYSEEIKVNHEKNRFSNEDWFTNNSRRNGQQSKKRMIDLGIKDECAICKLPPVWNNIKLTLQLDHIDGDKFNNQIENLRILCPNCHTQTETYSNNINREKIYYQCIDCKIAVGKYTQRCRACSAKFRKGQTVHNYPIISELIEMLQSSNFEAVGRELGMSGNAIKRHLIANNIDFKTIKTKATNSANKRNKTNK